MARPKGIISHIETKNRIIRVRLTARQYAETKQIANATNHKLAEILRKSLEDFLTKNREIIIKCRSKNYLSKPYFFNNNNNNNNSLSPKDKLTYEESQELREAWEKQDKYLSFLEKTLVSSLKKEKNLNEKQV